MLKWLALPALAVIAMLGTTPQAEAAAGYATGDVNMRTGPSTRYARITTIPRGAPVQIYGCSGSWCDTQYAGYRGWVSGNYLSSGGYRYRSVSPGAAAAGIIGLGVAGAILADRYDDRRYYRYRHHPRYHWRHRHHPRHHWRHRHHPRHHWRHRHHRHWGHHGQQQLAVPGIR